LFLLKFAVHFSIKTANKYNLPRIIMRELLKNSKKIVVGIAMLWLIIKFDMIF